MEGITGAQIKKLWALAREQGMGKEDLYALIRRESAQDSMKALSKHQAIQVINVLDPPRRQRRTDTSGPAWTRGERQKVYRLTGELGWNNNNDRINGFVKRMFRVERLEWLDEGQLRKLIEMLKKMVARKVAGEKAE